jgi:hypothetical protein
MGLGGREMSESEMTTGEYKFTITIFVVAIVFLVVFVVFIDNCTSEDLPIIKQNQNIDTGKAYVENDVHLVQGGDIIFSYTFHPFPCPHCGKQIDIGIDFPKED